MRILVLLVALLACSSLAFALMPPHITRVSPGAGQPLPSRIVKFYGYTLGAAPDAQVTAGGQPVAFESFMWSRQECQGRPGPCGSSGGLVAPGAEQTRSVLSIKLPPISEGASYEIRFLDASVRVVESGGRYQVAPAE